MNLLIFILFLGVMTHDEWALGLSELSLFKIELKWTCWGWCPQGIAQHPIKACVLLQGLRLLLMAFFYLRCHLRKKALADPSRKIKGSGIHHQSPWFRLGLVFLFLCELSLGSLVAVRHLLGDWPLIDELLVMLPTLFSLGIAWGIYFPIDIKVKQARLISDLDQDEHVTGLWSLGRYLKLHARLELATMGLPLMCIMLWREMFDAYYLNIYSWMAGYLPGIHAYQQTIEEVCLFIGTLMIFLAAPMLVLKVWQTRSLPDGETRSVLTNMLSRYQINVRQILLWHTYGGVANAAVIGILPKLRFILMTDRLLETMSVSSLKAIMAHELAHIRYRHLFWYLIVLMAITLSLSMLIMGVTMGLHRLAYFQPETLRAYANFLQPAIMIMGWWLAFGWVSRKFERQADTFAIQHFYQERIERLDRLGTTKLSQKLNQIDDAHESTAKMNQALSHELIEAEINEMSVQTRITIASEDISPMVEVLGSLKKPGETHMKSETETFLGMWLRLLKQFLDDVIISWRHGSLHSRQAYLRKLVNLEADKLPIHRTVKRIKWGSVTVILLFILLSILEVMIEDFHAF